MKIIEIREDSHKKLIKDAKKAEMIICELISKMMDLCEDSEYGYRKNEDFDDFDEEEDDDDIHYRSSRNMRRGRRSMRRGRYSY